MHLERMGGAYVGSAFGAGQFYSQKFTQARDLSAAEMGLQTHALATVNEGAASAYAHLTGQDWTLRGFGPSPLGQPVQRGRPRSPPPKADPAGASAPASFVSGPIRASHQRRLSRVRLGKEQASRVSGPSVSSRLPLLPFRLHHPASGGLPPRRSAPAAASQKRKKPMPSRATIRCMSVALSKPMTREQFFQWAETQDGRYEFDGEQPVALTGGTNNHGVIVGNVTTGLQERLRGKSCRMLPAEAGGVATIEPKIRYPDATVTCTPFRGRDRLIPNPIVVFEVVSERNARIDRFDKMREYHAVPSIKHYVLVEQATPVLVSYSRRSEEPWTATSLSIGDTLSLPEIGIDFPVAEIFDGVDFDEPSSD